MRRMGTLVCGGLVVGVLATATWLRLRACGPGSTSAVFTDIQVPDTPWAQAVRGQVGILRPGLPVAHLVVAYRHLAGLPVPPGHWDPPISESRAEAGAAPKPPDQRWQELTAARLGPPAQRLSTYRTTESYEGFANVADHAFETALSTWEARLKAHGGEEAACLEWLKAQDGVFRSTPKDLRLPEAVAAPQWLKWDRDYQRAAAWFYADRWEEARAAFHAIAEEPASPWRAWAGFLEARCWMRQASLGPEAGAPLAWREARRVLEARIPDPAFAAVRPEAEAYLEYVRFRVEPEVLEAEALAGLVAEDGGPGFLEQLAQARRRRGDKVPTLTPAAADLAAWLEAMAHPQHAEQVVIAHLQGKPSLPWLVAALALLPPEDARRAAWEGQVAQVQGHGVAEPTVRWFHTLAEVQKAKGADAVARVEAALRHPWPAWAENRLRAEGRAQAPTFEAWARMGGSRVVGLLEDYSERSSPVGELPPATAARYGAQPHLMDPAVTEQINRDLPLARLEDLAQAGGWEPALRRDVAHVAWVRALLLEDWAAEGRLRTLLDPEVKGRIPADLTQGDPDRRRFRIIRLLMAHPGLTPELEGGMGRSNEGWAPITAAVDFGTNWWCLAPKPGGRPKTAPPIWLTPTERQQREAEGERLKAFPSARHWFGEGITGYAARHPEDPDVPEALHRFVRITRNAACADKALSALSKQAFRTLHGTYPRSPWAAKTPVHY